MNKLGFLSSRAGIYYLTTTRQNSMKSKKNVVLQIIVTILETDVPKCHYILCQPWRILLLITSTGAFRFSAGTKRPSKSKMRNLPLPTAWFNFDDSMRGEPETISQYWRGFHVFVQTTTRFRPWICQFLLTNLEWSRYLRLMCFRINCIRLYARQLRGG